MKRNHMFLYLPSSFMLPWEWGRAYCRRQFWGLEAQPPTPEWGAMLSEGRQYIQLAPHVAGFPGPAIFILVLGFNLFGDGLRDILDPSLR